jgi:hypothetical protein
MSDEAAAAPQPTEALAGREWVTDTLARADKEVRSFLTEHPVMSLACAVGAGFLLARLLRGRS